MDWSILRTVVKSYFLKSEISLGLSAIAEFSIFVSLFRCFFVVSLQENEALALPIIESRLGYSKELAKRELQEFQTNFDRLEQRTVFVWPLAIIIPIFWPFVLIRFFILKYYKKKLIERSA